MLDMHSVDLVVCSCAPAAQQLINMGYFPCAPLVPTPAVSLKVLTLVIHLFVRIPPNTSAWCEAFESYLGGMGYNVDAKLGLLCCLVIISNEKYRREFDGDLVMHTIGTAY